MLSISNFIINTCLQLNCLKVTLNSPCLNQTLQKKQKTELLCVKIALYLTTPDSIKLYLNFFLHGECGASVFNLFCILFLLLFIVLQVIWNVILRVFLWSAVLSVSRMFTSPFKQLNFINLLLCSMIRKTHVILHTNKTMSSCIN